METINSEKKLKKVFLTACPDGSAILFYKICFYIDGRKKWLTPIPF